MSNRDKEIPEEQYLAARWRHFETLNNKTWGSGNWYQCNVCPLDAAGHPPYHHLKYHREA